jgi:hypothetical protein
VLARRRMKRSFIGVLVRRGLFTPRVRLTRMI